MASHHHCGPNVDAPLVHERDLYDVEVYELRRQVQQIQQRLECYEPSECEYSFQNSKVEYYNNEREIAMEASNLWDLYYKAPIYDD